MVPPRPVITSILGPAALFSHILKKVVASLAIVKPGSIRLRVLVLLPGAFLFEATRGRHVVDWNFFRDRRLIHSGCGALPFPFSSFGRPFPVSFPSSRRVFPWIPGHIIGPNTSWGLWFGGPWLPSRLGGPGSLVRSLIAGPRASSSGFRRLISRPGRLVLMPALLFGTTVAVAAMAIGSIPIIPRLAPPTRASLVCSLSAAFSRTFVVCVPRSSAEALRLRRRTWTLSKHSTIISSNCNVLMPRH